MPEKSNPYIEELKRFEKKDVVVSYIEGGEVKEVKGVLRAISHQHLSVIVATKKEKIIIKHIIRISRKRTNPEK